MGPDFSEESCVFEGGELFAPGADLLWVDLAGEDAFLIVCFGKDVAFGAYGDGTSGVVEVRV